GGGVRWGGGGGVEVALVGEAGRIEATLDGLGRTESDPIAVVHASEVVTMDDHPAQVLRGKLDSSMRVAVARVADGQADAVVSAGDSGGMVADALVVMARAP